MITQQIIDHDSCQHLQLANELAPQNPSSQSMFMAIIYEMIKRMEYWYDLVDEVNEKRSDLTMNRYYDHARGTAKGYEDALMHLITLLPHGLNREIVDNLPAKVFKTYGRTSWYRGTHV